MVSGSPTEPQVYREPFFSLRRPSRSVVSRFLAHILVRLLIVSALPGQWQAVAALFPVSMLWPLVAPQERASAPEAAASGPETRVRGLEQKNASCIGDQAPQAADTHRGLGLGYDGNAVERTVFTGYLWDKETNLFFAKARFYDPEVGRFISQDSYLGQVDDPPSLHRYFYANDNPTRYIDLTGHAGFKATGVDTTTITVDEAGNVYVGGVRATESVTVEASVDRAQAMVNDVAAATAFPNRLANAVAVRGMGVARSVAGGAEVVVGAGAVFAPEPVVTKIGGAALALHGADDFQAGLRQALTGEVVETATGYGIRKAAEGAGASPQTATVISAVGETVLVGGGMVALASRGPRALTAGETLSEGLSEARPAPSSAAPPPGDPNFIGPRLPEWKGGTSYGHLKDPKDVVKVTKPTPRQVRQMKDANRAKNEGTLRDDRTGELMVDSDKSRSGVTPPPNEAQVDHVQPQSKGGTRSFDNLELRTRQNNRDKWDEDPGQQE